MCFLYWMIDWFVFTASEYLEICTDLFIDSEIAIFAVNMIEIDIIDMDLQLNISPLIFETK